MPCSSSAVPVAPLSFIDDGSNEELSATTFFTLGDSFEDSATGTQAGSETLALTIVQGSTREQPPQTRARRARQATQRRDVLAMHELNSTPRSPIQHAISFGGFGPIFSIEANNGVVELFVVRRAMTPTCAPALHTYITRDFCFFTDSKSL